MAVTTKKTFPATTNATTTVFSPVSIQLNNQDDLDVYVTLSGGTRVLQLRQSTGSTATSNHPQVNDTTGLYFPAVSAGTTLYNYQLSTDNNTITFNSALPQGAVVSCERRTRDADSSYTTFASGSTIRATDLNNSSTESNFTAQDARNKAFDLEGKLFNGPADGSIKTKLDGIEANATQDQTASEIRALVESASDSNVFTDADHSKLNAIEAGATTDQTASEIRALVESASDSNVFTDADHSKLDAIEANATADQDASEIRALVESATDSNVFTDADHSKLDGIATGADVTSTNSINALTDVNTAGVADGKILKYDASVSKFVIADDGGGGGSGGSSTFTGLSDTPANFGSSAGKVLKVNSGETALEFSDADVVADTTPQLGGNLDVQSNEINTSTTNGNIKLNPNGTGVVEIKGDGSSADGTLQLNCSQNSHGVKIKSPPHSQNADYTVTLFNQDPSYLQHASFVKIDSNGQLSIDNKIYHEEPSHLNMGAFDITFDNTGGIIFDSATPSTATNNGKVQFFGPTTIANDVTFTVPNADGNDGDVLKTNGSGTLSFGQPEIVKDLSPQLGGNLDVNDKSIVFDTGISQSLKTGATNAVVNGVTQHVQQGSLTINGGSKDIFFTGGSSGSKITFGSSDGVTHEVMRITPSVLGASQHGKVELKYVTANAGSNTFSGTRLATTATGVAITGNAVVSNGLQPSADSTADIGTPSVRFANIYADTLYGDGQYLTNVNPTVANGCIYENSTEITSNHTTSTTKNSMSAGPITIANNVTLTIPNNSVYTIV